MKLYTLIIFYSLLLVSCDSTSELKLKEREEALKQKENKLLEKENKINDEKVIQSQNEIQKANTKYAYVVITVNKPDITSKTEDLNKALRENLQKTNREYSGSGVIPAEIPDPVYIATHNTYSRYFTYTSDIIEINGDTEDNKYRIMDSYQNGLERTLKTEDDFYSLKVNYKRTSTIEKRECKVFDSYTEASKSKNE
jgi:hypothetical protein